MLKLPKIRIIKDLWLGDDRVDREKANYYAIIPASVRYDNRLKANEKLLYGEIAALSNKTGECWASNKYFSDLYEVSKETISRWISNLSKLGYVRIVIFYRDGTKDIEKRIIKISAFPIDENINRYRQNNQEGIDENINRPIDENVKDNNTSINNTSINNTSSLLLTSNNNIDREGGSLKEVQSFYENNGFGTLSSKTIQDFNYWIDDFKKIGAGEQDAIDLIIHAMKLSVDNNVRKYSYVNSILKNWEQKHLVTVEQIEAMEKEREQTKQRQQPHRASNMPDYSTWVKTGDDF